MGIFVENRVQKGFLVAILEGNLTEAKEIIQRLRDVHPVEIFEEVIYPALVQVGELWCEGKISVAGEHRATQIVLNLMGSLRAARDFQATVDCRVAVGSVEKEEHYLGAMMVADAFRFEGWRVDFLGPKVPTADLVAIGQAGGVQVLVLSVCMEENLVQLNRLMTRLSESSEAVAKVVAGGRAVLKKRAWVEKLGARVAASPLEGIKIAKELLGPERFRLDLTRFLKELGDRVRTLRKRRGLTQQQLSEKAHMDRTYVVAVELGKTNLTIGALSKFAEALEVSLESILLGLAGSARTKSPGEP
jgi:methanogenic corrinoid protein MtbC1/DNA-binding XRE family transcriptional regulator